MNIKDIKVEDLPPVEGDMLELLFEMQTALEEKYRPIEAEQGFYPEIRVEDAPLDLNIPYVNWFLKDSSQRVIEEMCEGTNVLKNKQWKRTPVLVDEEHYLEEMADTLHFFIRNMIYTLGGGAVGARRLFELYRRKHAINDFRQRTNY